MKKKSYAARLGALAVALTMMTASLMGGTLAKYTSSVDGKGTAVIAKWNFTAGDNEAGSIAKTYSLSDTKKTGVAGDRIAPGTSGEIPVYIDLSGTEVATAVTVEIEISDVNKDKLPQNLKMTFDDKGTVSESQATVTKSEVTDLRSTGKKEVYKLELTEAQAKNLKMNGVIKWEWPYADVNDGNDTTDGSGADSAGAEFGIKITATQVAPTTK